MRKITLAEKVKKNFLKVMLKKSTVKVPRLRIKKEKQNNQGKPEAIPNSSIVSILLKSAVETAKADKEKKPAIDGKKYKIIKNDKPDAQGGYGTVSKNYGAAPQSSYVDYEKIFSYLGKFRAKGAYEDLSQTDTLSISTDSSSFELVDTKTMEKGARHVKYFFPHAADFYANLTSLVPVAGMNSGEWEQFKLMMQLDKVMYLFKTSTA